MSAPDRIWTSKCGKQLVTDLKRYDDDVAYIRADPAVILAAAMELPEVKALMAERDELAFMGRTLQGWTQHDVLVNNEGAFRAIRKMADRLAALKPDANG